MDCPIGNTTVLDISIFFATNAVLMKFIWLCSVLLVNWVKYWVEQKDSFLSVDYEVGAIKRNVFSCPKK